MARYPRRRDDAERGIVDALRAAGATVEQLDGKGLPDLLVGFRGRTLLLEVKDPVIGDRNSRRGGRGGGAKVENALGLRDSQAAWWAAWCGEPPRLVTTPSEALRAIAGNMPAPTAACRVCHACGAWTNVEGRCAECGAADKDCEED